MGIMPFLPAIGGLLGGLFGGGAAAPAAQGANSAAQAQANLTNTLMNNYTNTFAPAQAQALQQYQGMANAIPTQNIMQADVMRNLLPQQMPDILRSRAQYGIQNQTDQTYNAMQQELAKRGVTGPAAESILGHIREQGLQQQAGLASNIGAWEADATLKNRGTAADEALKIAQMPGQYAAGNAPGMANSAMLGSQDLVKSLSGAAAAASAPYVTAGNNLGTAAQQYYAQQPNQDQNQSPYNYPPIPQGGMTYGDQGY